MSVMVVDKTFYEEQGYLFPFTVVPPHEVGHLRATFERLRSLLPPGTPTEAMDWWHGLDRELYDICMTPAILDVVQEILGPDFFLWGSQFFAKDPGNSKTVPWHQDAFYWPLQPHKAVTAWLAFEDTDDENGGMRVVPGSQKSRLKHVDSNRDTDVLNIQTEAGQFSESDAVTLVLRAGQMSIHNDNIVHGSGPNTSTRLRCGLTMRFSAGDVKCDTNVWPFFRAFWARGDDRWNFNPKGTPPATLMTEFAQVTPRTGQK